MSQGIDDAAQSAGEASFSVAISVATLGQTLAFPGTARGSGSARASSAGTLWRCLAGLVTDSPLPQTFCTPVELDRIMSSDLAAVGGREVFCSNLCSNPVTRPHTLTRPVGLPVEPLDCSRQFERRAKSMPSAGGRQSRRRQRTRGAEQSFRHTRGVVQHHDRVPQTCWPSARSWTLTQPAYVKRLSAARDRLIR